MQGTVNDLAPTDLQGMTAHWHQDPVPHPAGGWWVILDNPPRPHPIPASWVTTSDEVARLLQAKALVRCYGQPIKTIDVDRNGVLGPISPNARDSR